MNTFTLLDVMSSLVAVSYTTAIPNYEKISGLTFGTNVFSNKEKSRRSWNGMDFTLTIIVFVIIAVIIIYFSPIGVAG